MSIQHPRIPELLAPAGSAEALRAAIANGADAVYLGVEQLNARRGAENFTLDTFADTCASAHLRGVRVYLTANVVILPAEMPAALDLVDRAWAAGVDAVIVQDLGLLRAIRRTLPDVRLHSSTQMNTHNSLTIATLAELGVSRITLSREVSVEEIAEFASASPIEIESFVHGALCVCYSGQCLMSSLIGRRSANRGMCAQPCRLPYELVGEGGVIATPGAHLLSPKDLAGLAQMPRLAEAGVAALKIEGRMKSPEYVALVTGVYRAALDRVAADPDAFRVRDGERAVLAESFSRGFSEAYLAGERGNAMMSYKRPNNRGVLIGRVTDSADGRATIALDSALESGDTVEFWTGAGRFAQPVGPMALAGGSVEAAPAGARVSVAVEEPVGIGDRVFRVRNAALSAAAARTFATDIRPIELDFDVTVVVGEPLAVTVRDAAGREGRAQDAVVEAARTKSVTAEEVAEHVGRLGGTPYTIGAWSLALSPGAGVGFSALHRVRRDAIAAYEASVLAPWSGRAARAPKLPRLGERAAAPRTRELVALVADQPAALVALEAGADIALVPTIALGAPRDLPAGVVPLIGRIVHDREAAAALAWAREGAPVVVGNLGLAHAAARAGASVDADWGLNTMNAYAIAQLAEMGARRVWFSPELSGSQLAEVAAQAVVPFGLTVFGRQELMVTEHCILMAEGECDRRCGSCARRAGTRVLRDRKGYEFPVVTDVTGRSHLYNSVALDLAPALGELVAAGISAVRLDLETEPPGAIARHVRRFRTLLQQAGVGLSIAEAQKEPGATSGHYYRGVL